MRKLMAVCSGLALALAAVACGGKESDEGAAVAGTTVEPARVEEASGAAYECDDFSMTLASGWEASPERFGMVNVLPEGRTSPGLYFKFEGKGNAVGTAEESINTMIAGYGGSPMESATIGGLEFKTTTYVYSGMTQTMHVAFRNGTKVTITIEGAGAKDDPDIRAMLGTVVFK